MTMDLRGSMTLASRQLELFLFGIYVNRCHPLTSSGTGSVTIPVKWRGGKVVITIFYLVLPEPSSSSNFPERPRKGARSSVFLSSPFSRTWGSTKYRFSNVNVHGKVKWIWQTAQSSLQFIHKISEYRLVTTFHSMLQNKYYLVHLIQYLFRILSSDNYLFVILSFKGVSSCIEMAVGEKNTYEQWLNIWRKITKLVQYLPADAFEVLDNIVVEEKKKKKKYKSINRQ